MKIATVGDVGLQGASDKRLLEHCRANGSILLTNDDDLLSITDAEPMPGIVFQTTQFVEPGAVIRAVVWLLDTTPKEEFRERVFFVP